VHPQRQPTHTDPEPHDGRAHSFGISVFIFSFFNFIVLPLFSFEQDGESITKVSSFSFFSFFLFQLQNSLEIHIRRWGRLCRGRQRVRRKGMNCARTFLCSELCGQLGIQLMTASSRASSAGSSFHASEKKEKIPIPVSRKSSSCFNASSLNAQLARETTTAGLLHGWPCGCQLQSRLILLRLSSDLRDSAESHVEVALLS